MTIANIIGLDIDRGKDLSQTFAWAGEQEVNLALEKAKTAAPLFQQLSKEKRASFLRTIASNIESLGKELVEIVMEESQLPEGRVVGERGRTCNQLRLFADVVEEGSWIEAIIDDGDPDRKPMPKSDIRKALFPLGPVVVFTASNFPLAFSTAGGDTASAFAAGCPVIVKAHEAHLKTNAMVAKAVRDAAESTGMPDGVFSSLQGQDYQLGKLLVQDHRTKAVAFTGSHIGGKALYDLAQQREEPIPVFAEMGSVNPVFILPESLESAAEEWSAKLAGSICLGVGQFCTNPGLIVISDDETADSFQDLLLTKISSTAAAKMLHQGIFYNFEKSRQAINSETEVTVLHETRSGADFLGHPSLSVVKGKAFLQNPSLQEEVFGPFSLLIRCSDEAERLKIADSLKGQLTATLVGSSNDLTSHTRLAQTLATKVGRLIYNGVPTGVEVGYAMQHGGPYPATTDGRFTSVGMDAIKRFVRPIAFQDCPNDLLPSILQNANPMGIWRKRNGTFGKD